MAIKSSERVWVGKGYVTPTLRRRFKKRNTLLTGQLSLDGGHAQGDPPVERSRQFLAFLVSFRSRCEKPRQKDKFFVAVLVHNPSLRSLRYAVH
jgi:hypothetical protein